MTDIDVPDWVLEASARAVAANAGEDYDSIGQFAQEVLKSTQYEALRAALSAWVVQQHQCMCTDEDEVPNGPRDIWMDVSADDYPKLTARNDVRGRTLYALRQEKPE